MFKSKLKNNLLTEYVEICKVQIFHKGKTENLIEKRANALKKKYEQIFLKIGCVDLSFFYS